MRVAPRRMNLAAASLLVALGVGSTGDIVGAATAQSPPAPPPAWPPTSSSATPPVGDGTPDPGQAAAASPTVAPPATGPVRPATDVPIPAPTDARATSPASVAEVAPRMVPTDDVKAAESDHDAVVGAWGVEVRPVATTLPVFARRASTGCPGTAMAPGVSDCPPVSVSMLAVRYWLGRNLGLTGGLALALGGGSDQGRLLDSYFGFGPMVGVSVLLGNWRHLAIAASPGLGVVIWKPASSADTTYLVDFRGDLEGELHFGFIGVPALSLGIRSGLLFRFEHAADISLWSVGVSGATTLRGLVSDLTLRYYF
jgi:hypothetical protein